MLPTTPPHDLLALTDFRYHWRMRPESGGQYLRHQLGEGRAPSLGAGEVREPFAQAQEVDAGGREDMAEVRARLADVARAPEAAGADPARQGALDPGAGGIRRRKFG